MPDFHNLIADKTVIMNKHFTPGRGGNRIKFVVIHINAGRLTTEGCYQTWQNREASAHYQIESDGTIGQLVWDADTAWHANDYEVNTQSIGIEHANNTWGPDWGVSDETLEYGARWVAALCRYYGLGRPEWGVNVFGHNDFSDTACPGALGGRQLAQYMSLAQHWYDQMSNGSTPPKTADASTGANLLDLAKRTLAGEFGNGEERVRRLGPHFDAVQVLVNQMVGEGGPSAPATTPKNVEVLAQEVLAGKHGNGQERIDSLGNQYEAVQARVNSILRGDPTSPTPAYNIQDLAMEVIAGKYGNGQERIEALRAIGADPVLVQQRVNEILS